VSAFRTRPMTREDAVAVNDLMAAVEAVDHTDEHYNLADVLEDFDNPMIEPAKDWMLVELEGVVVAHSRLMPRAPSDGSLSVGVDGSVHPAYRRRGIGTRLVPALVARAGDYVREHGEDLRPVITGSAPSGNTDLASLFEKSGLRPERWSFVMTADLEDRPGEPVPEMPPEYTLHTWEGIDHDEIRKAHNDAFVGHYGWTPWSAQMWGQWVADNRSLRPSLSLVARDREGAIAAYIETGEFVAVEEATGIREAYVVKVGTSPQHRRRGLAGVLLRIALERYRDEGFDRAALDVDSENATGALGIYERAGFRTQMRWTNYRLGE
jgi:mycothiol synthase